MTRCQAGYLTIYHSGYKRVWFQAEYLYDVDLSGKEKELEEYLGMPRLQEKIKGTDQHRAD